MCFPLFRNLPLTSPANVILRVVWGSVLLRTYFVYFITRRTTGTVCIGTFGLRGSVTNDNAAAAIDAAGAIIMQLHKIGIEASIGESRLALQLFPSTQCDAICALVCALSCRYHVGQGVLRAGGVAAAARVRGDGPQHEPQRAPHGQGQARCDTTMDVTFITTVSGALAVCCAPGNNLAGRSCCLHSVLPI